VTEPPPSSSPPRRPARLALSGRLAAPVAIAAVTVVLLAVALAEPIGGVLAGCCLMAAVVLAGAAVISRSATAAVLALVLVATAVIGVTGIALGRRASTSSVPGHAFPLVVGLPLDRAKQLFQLHGPVRFSIKRVAYGARGTVLRATGYSPDGTYSPGFTITLVVGTRAAAAPSPPRS
jgi:hypothetical protein